MNGVNDKIYTRELYCYQMASEADKKNPLVSAERYFDLNRLPTKGLKKEFQEYILHRGRVLSLNSIRSEFWPYNLLARFLAECYAQMQDLLQVGFKELDHEYRKWHIKNGFHMTKKHYRRELGKVQVSNSESLQYLKRIYFFLLPDDRPEYEKDTWNLQKFCKLVRQNPVKPITSLNFTGIYQEEMREEAKAAAELTLTYLSAATVGEQIRALRLLSQFLLKEYPEVDTFVKLDRDIIESYLIYLNTEAPKKQSWSRNLWNLKSVLEVIGKITDNEKLENLLMASDIPKVQRGLYRCYSESELQRINEAILQVRPQIARALALHQLLGNRISETLTLTTDCIVKRGGNWMVRVFLQKSQRTCYKPANADVLKLVEQSIQYTRENFGDRKYIFVSESQPDQPMKYSILYYNIMAMVRELDLKDDNGQLFGVRTHRFRSNYGQSLTEMHVPDEIIAKLLGHTNTGSVKYYRRLGDQKLADETREVRNQLSAVIAKTVRSWDDA